MAKDTSVCCTLYSAYLFSYHHHVVATEMAQGFWAILIPHGLSGGALSHTENESESDDDAMEDVENEGKEGWKPEYLDWWFEFLAYKGTKAINSDTWKMVRLFSPS